MKLQTLISKVLLKVAPMSNEEANDINVQSDLWFTKQKNALKDKLAEDPNAKLDIKDKAIKIIDEWYVRAAFAVLYVFIVKWVTDFMNPGDDYDDEPYPDDHLLKR